jgi:predicted ATPase
MQEHYVCVEIMRAPRQKMPHSVEWVVTHSAALADALTNGADVHLIELEKQLGQTQVKGQSSLDRPYWKWVE